MSDSLYDGRRFRLLTLVDTMSRESPLIAVERSFSGENVAGLLDQVAQRVGLPDAIQVDNGPEFTSNALDEWAARNSVKLIFSRPGTPTDNPSIEAFSTTVVVVVMGRVAPTPPTLWSRFRPSASFAIAYVPFGRVESAMAKRSKHILCASDVCNGPLWTGSPAGCVIGQLPR